MKKIIKILIIVIISILGIILIDTVQARIFKNSPILSIEKELEDPDSRVDKGIIIDTYYCTKEQDIITVYWKFKNEKFTCPVE